MDDCRSLEEDYIRRLELEIAQRSGDQRPIPLVDETRVRYCKLIPLKKVVSDLWGELAKKLALEKQQ